MSVQNARARSMAPGDSLLDMSQSQNGISSGFSSQNLRQIFTIEFGHSSPLMLVLPSTSDVATPSNTTPPSPWMASTLHKKAPAFSRVRNRAEREAAAWGEEVVEEDRVAIQ